MFLTELIGDDVWNIDIAITGALPFAATGGARVSILEPSVHGNITLHDLRIIKFLPWKIK